jgi:hypothetical protein
MRRIISNHSLLNWHNAAKLPISRQAGLRRDRNAAAQAETRFLDRRGS